MISRILAAVIFFAFATSAHAAETWTETWTCTHSSISDNRPATTHFEVSPPKLIEANFHQTYNIEKNNDYGIVATLSISEIEKGHKDPTVGVVSIIINKTTGEFWWVSAIAGQAAALNQPIQGKCVKD
jgi:hypothetical protein